MGPSGVFRACAHVELMVLGCGFGVTMADLVIGESLKEATLGALFWSGSFLLLLGLCRVITAGGRAWRTLRAVRALLREVERLEARGVL